MFQTGGWSIGHGGQNSYEDKPGKTHSENKIALELLMNSCGLTMATVNKKQYLVMNNRFIEGTIKHNHHIFFNFYFLHVSKNFDFGTEIS